MITIGALVLGFTVFTQLVFVGPGETKQPELCKHSIDSKWEY